MFEGGEGDEGERTIPDLDHHQGEVHTSGRQHDRGVHALGLPESVRFQQMEHPL